MANRKGKRNRKFNGTRNHGKGNAKNRRGKGGKGGWGRAGMSKHRFTYVTRYERHFMRHGGRMGFSNQNAREELPVINLYEIDQLARNGKVEAREGKLTFDFEGKVLGTGSITVPVVVRAISFSEKAKEKLKACGGSAVESAPKEAPAAEKKAE
ncbi:MAG: uL15m family ribosomal protein [Candidatus Micrarchaeia archaeon]